MPRKYNRFCTKKSICNDFLYLYKKTMNEEINWVFLRSFVWPHEYYTLQAFLESNGVRVSFRDELIINIDPFLSNALGGIKMYVAEEDYDLAIVLSEEFYEKRLNDNKDAEEDTEEDKE